MLCGCIFRTKYPECISSLKTTKVPKPLQLLFAATLIEARILAGPSAPRISGFRIAPVTIIGISVSIINCNIKAVSSIVSVPCITTNPSYPSSINDLIFTDRLIISLIRSAELEDFINDMVSTSAISDTSSKLLMKGCKS